MGTDGWQNALQNRLNLMINHHIPAALLASDEHISTWTTLKNDSAVVQYVHRHLAQQDSGRQLQQVADIFGSVQDLASAKVEGVQRLFSVITSAITSKFRAVQWFFTSIFQFFRSLFNKARNTVEGVIEFFRRILQFFGFLASIACTVATLFTYSLAFVNVFPGTFPNTLDACEDRVFAPVLSVLRQFNSLIKEKGEIVESFLDTFVKQVDNLSDRIEIPDDD